MHKLLLALEGEFKKILGISHLDLSPNPAFYSQCQNLTDYLSRFNLLPFESRKQEFLAHVNWKFRVNAEHLAIFYGHGAKLGRIFNYHEKSSIQRVFNRCELGLLPELLRAFGLDTLEIDTLATLASCASHAQTKKIVCSELKSPSKLRREQGDRDVQLDILQALFASFLWVSLPAREMHQFFDVSFDPKQYQESFWSELQLRSPRLFHRDQALHFIVVNQEWTNKCVTAARARDAILNRVQKSYEELNNYGFLITLIESAVVDGRDISWEIAADIALFGEKHLEHPTDRTYFRHDHISQTTFARIPNINIEAAHFERVNEGFSYRDCFILTSEDTGTLQKLLVLQKNHRDETLVPCPTCRSSNVEGNSYPSLGVKSWECCNLLCPDRSKYNRGKRYSFRGLATQQALDDERNEIPEEFVKRWRRDVVDGQNQESILEMFVRHYSMWGDSIQCFGELKIQPSVLLGRSIHWQSLQHQSDGTCLDWFEKAAFFKRYGLPRTRGTVSPGIELGDSKLRVLCGDSRNVLRSLDTHSIDGAVTSPPYYNAREYSQWPNIYCYLQDMFEVNEQVFRVLKHGGLYFYNIFDYFDNENIVALSAMGNKRLVLSAYTIDLFRRIGFECIGNIVWDKGEIEGKRGFNAGNFSPFYQSPFNCWEHVLIFKKPGSVESDFGGSRVLRAKPVIKMVRGKNLHGHSAPFPEAIPRLCIDNLTSGGTVLDPFGGSLTTGRVAVQAGMHAICIEQSREYCELGLSLYAVSSSPPQMELVL